MKKNLLLLLFAILSTKSLAQKKNKERGFGTRQRTANPNTPFIYKNGYLNYSILKKAVVLKKDSVNVHVLKFNAVFSAMYSKKVMYDKFGKWTIEIRPNFSDQHPILVWEKVKLFENEDKLYTVYADGDESWEEIYASFMVFDENNDDCLSDSHSDKTKVIEYFSNGIKNLSNNKDFYTVYWQSVNSFKPKISK